MRNPSRPLWAALIIAGLIASAVLVPIVNDGTSPPALNHYPAIGATDESLPADVTADWWAATQEKIRESEYHITWQHHTYIADLPATYQAPNRAHDLQTCFVPEVIHVVPRALSESEEAESVSSLPWEEGLTFTGYGYADQIQPVPTAELFPSANRIEYHRDTFGVSEWCVNNEGATNKGFTLITSPLSTIKDQPSEIFLELALSGNLTPHLVDDGAAIQFMFPRSVRVQRHSEGDVSWIIIDLSTERRATTI